MQLAIGMTSGEHLLIPLVTFAAIGLLALVLRWSHPPRKARRRAASRGLLVPIAQLPNRAAAQKVAARLRRSGIRSTTTTADEGVDVLVWQEQYAEARLRLSGPDHGS